MTLIEANVPGRFMSPSNTPFSKGRMDLIELDQPFDGRRYGVLQTETQGGHAVRERLGRVQKAGDQVTIKRFELGSEALLVHEIA
jgi:hypothetical protein